MDLDIDLTTRVLNSLMRAYGDSGLTYNAAKVWEQILRGPGPDNASITTAIDFCTKHGIPDSDMVGEIWETLDKYGLEPDAGNYASLVKFYNRFGRFNLAEKLILGMPRDIVDKSLLEMFYLSTPEEHREMANKVLETNFKDLWKPNMHIEK